MRISFLKMHGLGNDFVVIDERVERHDLSPALIASLCDRHRGIGCDQLVTLRAACLEGADVFVRFFNADGTESSACGNASRCIALLIAQETGRKDIVLQTRAGRLPTEVTDATAVAVNMGAPRFAWSDIPLRDEVDTLMLPVEGAPSAASMGNPHVTFFVEDLAAIDPTVAGPPMEWHPLFPEGANIGFAQQIGPDHLRLRVWERGSGLTLACGSGACAAAVNAMRRGLVGTRCRITMDGGDLVITWSGDACDPVWMTGPAAHAFSGSFDTASFAA